MTTFDEAPIGHRTDGSPIYDNAATVVCPVVTMPGGFLLVIRRARNPGNGLLALPAGFHMRGETWQQCGAREVSEETGYMVSILATGFAVFPVTDHFGHNLMFPWAKATGASVAGWRRPEAEIAEVCLVGDEDPLDPDDWAFPLHLLAARKWQSCHRLSRQVNPNPTKEP